MLNIALKNDLGVQLEIIVERDKESDPSWRYDNMYLLIDGVHRVELIFPVAEDILDFVQDKIKKKMAEKIDILLDGDEW